MPKPVDLAAAADPAAGAGEELPVVPEIYALRPWYHDFERLGLRTDFDDPVGVRQRLRGLAARWVEWSRRRAGGGAEAPAGAAGAPLHRTNQRIKERLLVPWLGRAVEDVGPGCRALDLFCADGYYSCVLARMGAGVAVHGVDREAEEIERARAAARALGLTGASFAVADVHDFVESTREPFDLVLCAGGLYHLAEPWKLLAAIRRLEPRLLVVQSVVTLETEAADYFVSPAPRWRHGSRFTHARLGAWLEECGWRVRESRRAELPGNPRLSDRGSSFYLCGLAG